MIAFAFSDRGGRALDRRTQGRCRRAYQKLEGDVTKSKAQHTHFVHIHRLGLLWVRGKEHGIIQELYITVKKASKETWIKSFLRSFGALIIGGRTPVHEERRRRWSKVTGKFDPVPIRCPSRQPETSLLAYDQLSSPQNSALGSSHEEQGD